MKNKFKHNRKKSSTLQPISDSRAPYNFVPLNDKIVPGEPIPPFDRYHEDRFTGYIDLTITALTPIYIRDTLSDAEYKEKLKYEKEGNENYINPEFFSPGNLYRIPGSSLRGMIRTLVEIVTYGKFEFFDDKRLYFRFLADSRSELRNYYRARLGRVDAGILKRTGRKDYRIQPTGYEKRRDVSRTEEIIDNDSEWIIYSGEMLNKKHNWVVTKTPSGPEMHVDYEKVIKSYKEDTNRRSNINLLAYLGKEEFKNGVPCFYAQKNNEIIGIGHTRYFRIPYEKTIGECVRQSETSILDIPKAIFGDERSHAGRVFFEDAFATGQVELYPQNHPKILSTPKPTCIQHYLQQPEGRTLQHYDSPAATIRGYKLYWHRDGKNWIEQDKDNINKHKTQYTLIRPIKEGTTFKGRIRFENLTEVELGALLFVLSLPEGLAHKIGMAKPLGLGSIRIEPRLYLSNRRKRYTELFAEWSILEDTTSRISEFKKKFENYVLKHLGEKEESLWALNRLCALEAMLNYKNKPSYEKTEYLPLESFRKRPLLPRPEEVLKRS